MELKLAEFVNLDESEFQEKLTRSQQYLDLKETRKILLGHLENFRTERHDALQILSTDFAA